MTETLLSVGAVAAELGLAPETLRSYGRRYGLVPSARTAGGHRRYTPSDVERLVQMQTMITDGMSPARAAAAVLRTGNDGAAAGVGPDGSGGTLAWGTDAARYAPGGDPFGVRFGDSDEIDGSEAADGDRRRPGGPGGRVLAVPGAGPEVRGLARAVSRLDATAITETVVDLLVRRGTVDVWDNVLRPVLIAAGLKWARTGEGVELEHVLSESAMEALRRYRALYGTMPAGPPVLLACFPDDQHVLPLHLLAAALTEVREQHLLLGPRVPFATLISARQRTGARAVFVWRQLAGVREEDTLELMLPRTRPAVQVVLGGPGWDRVQLPPNVSHAQSLADAVTLLRTAGSPS